MLTTSSLLEVYNEQGYVVVPGVLDYEQDLQPIVAEYEEILDGLIRRWQAEGLLKSEVPKLQFGERLTRAVSEAQVPFDRYFDISLPQGEVREDTPVHVGPAVFNLLRNPRLLDAVEELLGTEIESAPIQHARIKIPESRLPQASRTGLTGSIGWHQDLATVVEEADGSDLLTVWLPMTEAKVVNGCLAVVPGSHRAGLAVHCRINDQVCIPEEALPAASVPVEMSPGDVLLMHRRTMHAGLPNQSETIRWSFDLRYQPLGQPAARPWFPAFVARSRSHPERELKSAEVWAKLWSDTRQKLAHEEATNFYRWKNDDPLCA